MMIKKLKILEDDILIYEGNLSVNTVILKGKLAKNPMKNGKATNFNLQISGGKNPQTDEWQRSASPKGDTIRPKGVWRKPTYVDCTAFGELGELISKHYSKNDEIWFIGKFYINVYNGKTYKGFIVRELIKQKENSTSYLQNVELMSDEDLPF